MARKNNNLGKDFSKEEIVLIENEGENSNEELAPNPPQNKRIFQIPEGKILVVNKGGASPKFMGKSETMLKIFSENERYEVFEGAIDLDSLLSEKRINEITIIQIMNNYESLNKTNSGCKSCGK